MSEGHELSKIRVNTYPGGNLWAKIRVRHVSTLTHYHFLLLGGPIFSLMDTPLTNSIFDTYGIGLHGGAHSEQNKSKQNISFFKDEVTNDFYCSSTGSIFYMILKYVSATKLLI